MLIRASTLDPHPPDRALEVIVVSRKPRVWELIGSWLDTQPGVRATLVNDSADGLRRFEAARPEFLILDAVSAEDLLTLKRFKKIDPHVPVVAFAAYASPARVVEALRFGAVEVLGARLELENLIQRTVVLGSEAPARKTLREDASRAAILARDAALHVDVARRAAALSPILVDPADAHAAVAVGVDASSLKSVARRAADQVEVVLIKLMLERTNGDRKQRAINLGICYKALITKAKKHGLTPTAHAMRRTFRATGARHVSPLDATSPRDMACDSTTPAIEPAGSKNDPTD